MSDIRANTISDAAGTGPIALTGQSAAKAWVNINGSGTIAARDSLNVASLTDNGTGDYTVNFSNAFGSDNYSFNFNFAAGGNASINAAKGNSANISSSSVRFETGSFQVSVANVFNDVAYATTQIHGDLA